MGRFEEKTRYCINENDCIHKSDDNLEKATIVRGPKTIKLFGFLTIYIDSKCAKRKVKLQRCGSPLRNPTCKYCVRDLHNFDYLLED